MYDHPAAISPPSIDWSYQMIISYNPGLIPLVKPEHAIIVSGVEIGEDIEDPDTVDSVETTPPVTMPEKSLKSCILKIPTDQIYKNNPELRRAYIYSVRAERSNNLLSFVSNLFKAGVKMVTESLGKTDGKRDEHLYEMGTVIRSSA